MSTHLKVPLKNLRFGHEAPKHPSNARVTGRLDGIEALAANIFARGLIEDLIVFDDGVPDTWFVADGNRSLAALRLIHGNDSSELIDCKSRPADMAFEDSLAVAVMGHKLHPIDEYEGFAKLRDDCGNTEAEIAQQYGLTEREVEQVLALGNLSPKIREAWRKGEIKSKTAKAFTLAPDHKTQDEIFDALKDDAETGRGSDLSDLDDSEVKDMLKIGEDNAGALVEFVGIDAYVKRGGKVTRDLFGTDHKVSDNKLAKAMAAEKLKQECERLVQSGWSFAVTTETVKNTQYSYGRLKAEAKPTPEEQAKLDALSAICNPGKLRRFYAADSFAELTAAQQRAYLEFCELSGAIEQRAYPAKLMATAGCFVGIDDDGFLDVEFGRIKPAKVAAAAKVEKQEKRESAKTEAKTAGKPAPESATLSNALKDRLEAQLIQATRDAIAEEAADVSSSPLTEILAKVVCAQIDPNRPFAMPDAVRTKLPSIRQVIGASKFNLAIAKRFEPEDYFSNAPKSFVIKAIAEAINPDEARKVSTGKTKAEIWKFALANLAKTGWLPKELRTVHYAGPGSEHYKKPPAAIVPGPPVLARPPAKTVPVKRAAASKKAAKKTSAKKRKG
jgi:ParB family chromosome partitioning protein